MPSTTPRFPRRSGFTLIELLTVIAIIGILAAIIIPTVGAVRKRAKIAQTTSNMRQVGQAVATYLAENKDLMPYAKERGGLQPSTHDFVRLIAVGFKGSGNYDDPATRLGAHLAPYLSVRGAVGSDVAIPALSDSLWKEAAIANGAPVDTYWCMPTFVLNPGLSRTFHPSIDAATVYPWGKDSGSPFTVAASSGYGKVMSQIGAPSRVWAMIQNDRQLLTDSLGLITAGMVGASSPATPVNGGSSRLALMFDWSVRGIETSFDLRKPL